MNRTSVRAVLVGLSAAATLAVGACSTAEEPTRDEDGEITEANDNADVFALEVGDCIAPADDSATEVTAVPVVPCAEEHGGQIYAATDMPDGDFPGTDAIDTKAEEFCLAEFEPFIGLAYEESELEVYPFTPTSESWAQGDREIQCVAHDPSGQVAGPLENAAR